MIRGRSYGTIMRAIGYVLIVIVAFTAILLNALYGHYVYGSTHEQALSKYAIYIHLDARGTSANILYDVTVSWDGTPLHNNTIQYNSNSVQEVGDRQIVSLQHGFSDCQVGWSPPLYRYGVDLLRSTIDYIQGRQLNQEPYTPIFADIKGTAQHITPKGHAQFIPICTNAESTSFRYSVSTDVSFDVYFVPSGREAQNYMAHNGTFDAYSGCHALNRHSYTGFCSNVGPDSGLLIVLLEDPGNALTRISVNLHEITSSPAV